MWLQRAALTAKTLENAIDLTISQEVASPARIHHGFWVFYAVRSKSEFTEPALRNPPTSLPQMREKLCESSAFNRNLSDMTYSKLMT